MTSAVADGHDVTGRNPGAAAPIRIGFVLHVMQVAGAEVLVAETIRRLGGVIQPSVLCLDAVGALGEQMRAEGVPVVNLGRRPGLDLPVARRLAREVAARDIEVVHAHQYTPFFYSALGRLLTRRRVHVIFTEHGRHYPDAVSAKRRLVNRLWLSRLADEINAVCRFSARSLADIDGFGGRPIEVIHNGIDPARYGQPPHVSDARARLGLDPARRFIVCIARFHPVKDHTTLLESFAAVAASRPDVDLLLAGDGPLRGDLERLAAELGIADRTRFLGIRGDVPALLQAADIFSLTSLSEAASLTLLEAMASALPVVVTNVGGNPEIVENGVHGYLRERGDAAGIAAALVRLLDDPAAARAMGCAGQRRVHEHFQLATTVNRHYERYAAAVRTLRSGTAEPAAT